jgi:molybdopterin converting factor small subunit
MATVHIPALLRPLLGGKDKVQATGETLRAVIVDLERQYPALAGRVIDAAGIRPEIALAVGNEEAFGLDQAVPADGDVHILPAIAGG